MRCDVHSSPLRQYDMKVLTFEAALAECLVRDSRRPFDRTDVDRKRFRFIGLGYQAAGVFSQARVMARCLGSDLF